jgi:hypothetical protein
LLSFYHRKYLTKITTQKDGPMKYASHLFILFFCISTTVFCYEENRDLAQALKQVKETAPIFIDWTIVQIREYPIVPAILTAGFIRWTKETITSKRASFVIWAALGVALVEPYQKFANNYLQLKDAERYQKRRNVDWSDEIHKASEDAKNTGRSVATAVKNMAFEKASEKIDDMIGNDNKK